MPVAPATKLPPGRLARMLSSQLESCQASTWAAHDPLFLYLFRWLYQSTAFEHTLRDHKPPETATAAAIRPLLITKPAGVSVSFFLICMAAVKIPSLLREPGAPRERQCHLGDDQATRQYDAIHNTVAIMCGKLLSNDALGIGVIRPPHFVDNMLGARHRAGIRGQDLTHHLHPLPGLPHGICHMEVCSHGTCRCDANIGLKHATLTFRMDNH